MRWNAEFKGNIEMTPSELKSLVEQAGHEPYFFDSKVMRFFGDTMRNYGVRDGGTILYNRDVEENYIRHPREIQVWELYRKHPVKYGMKESAYFDKENFRCIVPYGIVRLT